MWDHNFKATARQIKERDWMIQGEIVLISMRFQFYNYSCFSYLSISVFTFVFLSYKLFHTSYLQPYHYPPIRQLEELKGRSTHLDPTLSTPFFHAAPPSLGYELHQSCLPTPYFCVEAKMRLLVAVAEVTRKWGSKEKQRDGCPSVCLLLSCFL